MFFLKRVDFERNSASKELLLRSSRGQKSNGKKKRKDKKIEERLNTYK
jgi:hypothetical protein